jgi:hypothetical protein
MRLRIELRFFLDALRVGLREKGREFGAQLRKVIEQLVRELVRRRDLRSIDRSDPGVQDFWR